MEKPKPVELLYSLVGYPHETEWLEFKVNSKDSIKIGKDISALANTASWLGREVAYRIWGVDDKSHALVGTNFNPTTEKAQGNQSLPIWLKRMLTPNANYEFQEFTHEGKNYVILTIRAAVDQPVSFQNRVYIREGSSTVQVTSGSSKEAELWRRLQRSDFEQRIALEDVQPSEIGRLLNIDTFFNLLNLRIPSSTKARVQPLLEQQIVKEQDNRLFSITNLGAVLLARTITEFPGLINRPIRVVRFAGKSNREILDDRMFDEGYATALQSAEAHIMSSVATGENTDGAFRRVQYAYPQRAIRELLANAVIHQDLSVTTQGPLVAIYDNRIEFSNPGCSLVQSSRVLNALPQTRNKRLVALLRQMDICEEVGTGWDIAVESCEALHMLPPKMEIGEDVGTRVIMFRGDSYKHMTKAERLEALYWHACLRYADREAMNNKSLRERFGLDDSQSNSLAMSRLIKDACASGLVKIDDEDAGTRNRQYIPGWA